MTAVFFWLLALLLACLPVAAVVGSGFWSLAFGLLGTVRGGGWGWLLLPAVAFGLGVGGACVLRAHQGWRRWLNLFARLAAEPSASPHGRATAAAAVRMAHPVPEEAVRLLRSAMAGANPALAQEAALALQAAGKR